MKQITASIPADVVERLTALRLDADVAGRGFKLTEFVSAALLALPSQPSRVAGLIERYSNQLNFELTSRDEGYLVEKRLSTQITPDAAQRVATIARDVYQSYGTKLSHKDIYAVALLNALATKS